MHWRKWPYWLRGGVIGGGAAIVSGIMFFVCPIALSVFFATPLSDEPGMANDADFACVAILLFSPLTPVAVIWDDNPFLDRLPPLLLPVVSAALWFPLGAVLGAIIGTIKKNRKKKRSSG